MRMTLEGKITLSFFPPNFNQEFWDNHPNLVQINELLGMTEDNHEDADEEFQDSSEEEQAVSDADDEKEVDGQLTFPTVSRNKFDLLVDEDD